MQLEVQKLSQKNPGLQPTSSDVTQGGLIAVVGHNGAGKSTLLRVLGGWLVPDDGLARVNGITLDNRLVLTPQIGFVPEAPNLSDVFSVEYNLTLFARLFRIPHTRIDEVLREFNLLDFRHDQRDPCTAQIVSRIG